MMKKKPLQWVDADFQQPLCLRWRSQGITGCPKMKGDDRGDGKQSDRGGDHMGTGPASEDNFRHLKSESMRDHESDVDENKTDEDDQTDKVQTADRLSAAKDSGKPGKPRSQCR